MKTVARNLESSMYNGSQLGHENHQKNYLQKGT
jgi:hypothetical protein